MKPKAARQITQEEADSLSNVRGSRQFKWQFEDELFDGNWWALDIPNDQVNSALNSFRNQCETIYKTRASGRKAHSGELLVRRLVDQPKETRRSYNRRSK